MSTPHPSIEGVTVREYDLHGVRLVDGEYTGYVYKNRELTLGDRDVRVRITHPNPKIQIECWSDEIPTVIAMIRDQAAWLEAQGATT